MQLLFQMFETELSNDLWASKFTRLSHANSQQRGGSLSILSLPLCESTWLLYKDHLNKHFRIMDYHCDECDANFFTKRDLTVHSLTHEGNMYCCLICNIYETARKYTMKYHLRAKHSDLLGKNINWDSVKEHVKLKSIIWKLCRHSPQIIWNLCIPARPWTIKTQQKTKYSSFKMHSNWSLLCVD